MLNEYTTIYFLFDESETKHFVGFKKNLQHSNAIHLYGSVPLNSLQ